jgi:RNA polymerase sigma-B factor
MRDNHPTTERCARCERSRSVEDTIPRPADDRSGRSSPSVDPDLWQLHLRVADHGCPNATADLVDHYEGTVKGLARRCYRRREPLEDLEQVAFEALIAALRRFDPSRGIPFLAFATPTIIGVLKRHYRDAGWSMRVPRWMHELNAGIGQARQTLLQELCREPTAAEIAELLDTSVERVERALHGSATREVGCLDDVVGGAYAPGGRQDRQLQLAEDCAALDQALSLLDQDDRWILDLYFGDDLTQSEVGEHIGLSQMQVSRRMRRITARLRSELVA